MAGVVRAALVVVEVVHVGHVVAFEAEDDVLAICAP
jgi:hypothetical protein